MAYAISTQFATAPKYPPKSPGTAHHATPSFLPSSTRFRPQIGSGSPSRRQNYLDLIRLIMPKKLELCTQFL